MIYVYCNIIYIIQWFWEPFYLFDDIPWYTHLYNPELIWLVSHSESGFLSHEGTRKSSLCQTIIVIFFNNYGNARLWKSPLIFQDPSIHPSVRPSIHRSVKWGDFMGRQSLGYEDFMGTYPLANIQKAVENPPFEWVNQLFLWSFSIAMLNYGQDWGLSRNGRMNVSGKLISLRRRSVLRLWYICGLAWSKTTFWKNQSEKWTLCGLHTFRPFPLFQSFSLLWRARNL